MVTERKSVEERAQEDLIGAHVDTRLEFESVSDDEAELVRLAVLPPTQYDRERKEAAERLSVRQSTLDKQVAARRREAVTVGIDFPDIDPWPHPVEPATLLSEVADAVRRFIVCAPETAHAVALWAAMTWVMDAVSVAPLAVITAPEKRCGKSQLLFLLGKLVRRPLAASNISPAALFRSIDAWAPTLLVDEADAFLRENEELRGLLNCGHTRDSAYVVRVVGEDFTPVRFNVWGAKALAGIGHLADTLMDRAVVLELRRKLSHETVDRLRYAEPGMFDALAAKFARFADDYRERVRKARPDLPSRLNDRAQDNWEPLLAIAEVAGGDWPVWARAAALKLSGSEGDSASIGEDLLADIRHVYEAKRTDRLSTTLLLEALCADEEAPWATWSRGKPMSARQLARHLEGFGIKSGNLRIGHNVAKGYERSKFEDAFSRYLAVSPSLPGAATSATPLQASTGEGLHVAGKRPVADAAATPHAEPVTDEGSEAATQNPSATLEALLHKDCSGVADREGGAGGEEREVFDL